MDLRGLEVARMRKECLMVQRLPAVEAEPEVEAEPGVGVAVAVGARDLDTN